MPVWLVPTELREEVLADTLPGRYLVVPLSGSKMAEAAIQPAIDLLEQRHAESDSGLVLLYVSTPIDPITAISRTSLKEREEEEARMRDYLEATAQSIREQGLNVRTEVVSGDPAEAIIEYLRTNPAQLLVMATRGHNTLSRMIFGSVTETVLNMVKKTPLLLVSADEE